jgi:hypothetical protein
MEHPLRRQSSARMHRHAIGSDDANDNHGATRIMKLPTLKIGARMMSGFMAVIALMLIVGLFAQVNMRELANTTDRLYLHPFTVSKYRSAAHRWQHRAHPWRHARCRERRERCGSPSGRYRDR